MNQRKYQKELEIGARIKITAIAFSHYLIDELGEDTIDLYYSLSKKDRQETVKEVWIQFRQSDTYRDIQSINK